MPFMLRVNFTARPNAFKNGKHPNPNGERTEKSFESMQFASSQRSRRRQPPFATVHTKKHWKTNAKWNQSTYWAYTKLDSAEKGQFCLVIALSLFKAVGRRRTGARQEKRQFGTRTVHFATESLRFGPILDTQLINQIRKIAKPKTHIQRLGK